MLNQYYFFEKYSLFQFFLQSCKTCYVIKIRNTKYSLVWEKTRVINKYSIEIFKLLEMLRYWKFRYTIMYRQINVQFFSANFRSLLLIHFDVYARENRAASGKYWILKKTRAMKYFYSSKFCTYYFLHASCYFVVRHLAFVQLVSNIRGVTAANFEITRVHDVSSTATYALVFRPVGLKQTINWSPRIQPSHRCLE